MNNPDLQGCFVTWSDETSDREDCEFYQPEYIALERTLAKQNSLRLEEVADFAQRIWTPSQSEQPFSYIDIASVNIRTGDVQAVEMPEAEAPSRARKRVQKGDIIVSTVRPERNAVAFIRDELDGYICSNGFAVMTPRMGTDPYALYAFLKSSCFIVQAVRRSTASMYPAVAEECLKDVLIPRQIIEGGEQISRAVRAAFQEQERFLARLRDIRVNIERLMTKRD